MARGSEAYLQMWERASGVSNDACRDATVRKPTSTVLGVDEGDSTTDVLEQAGIPHERLGSTFEYCTKASNGDGEKVRVTFNSSGKVTSVEKV
jgi:hypothetical protein